MSTNDFIALQPSYQNFVLLTAGYCHYYDVPDDVCHMILQYYVEIFAFRWVLSEANLLASTLYLPYHSDSFDFHIFKDIISFRCGLYGYDESTAKIRIEISQFPVTMELIIGCCQVYCPRFNLHWKVLTIFKSNHFLHSVEKFIKLSHKHLCVGLDFYCYVDVLVIQYHQKPMYLKSTTMDERIQFQWDLEQIPTNEFKYFSPNFGTDLYGNWCLEFERFDQYCFLVLILLRLPTGIGEIDIQCNITLITQERTKKEEIEVWNRTIKPLNYLGCGWDNEFTIGILNLPEDETVSFKVVINVLDARPLKL